MRNFSPPFFLHRRPFANGFGEFGQKNHAFDFLRMIFFCFGAFPIPEYFRPSNPFNPTTKIFHYQLAYPVRSSRAG
jgi:hypothetical protein